MGSHSLLDIAERAELPFAIVRSTAELLQAHGLLTSQRGHADGPEAQATSESLSWRLSVIGPKQLEP